MNRILCFSLITLTLLSAARVALAEEPGPPEVSLEGLELVEKDRRGELYADPDVDWNAYTAIQLDKATVAFRRNWQRDQNRYQPFKVKNSDMEKIKNNMSELFGEVFTEELTTKGGYTITQEAGDNVMRIEDQHRLTLLHRISGPDDTQAVRLRLHHRRPHRHGQRSPRSTPARLHAMDHQRQQ
jgi:hypothetical protein